MIRPHDDVLHANGSCTPMSNDGSITYADRASIGVYAHGARRVPPLSRGYLVPEAHGDQVRLVCNECSAVVATIATAQLEAGATFPRIYGPDAVTLWSGSGPRPSSIDAFICSECGQGVHVERPIQ